MSWALYDYVDAQGRNDFEAWSANLQKPELAKLNRKLKALEDNGPDLLPQMLAGPLKGYAHIYKLKINGRVALRPLLCKGPIDNEREFTLLKGAFEVGNRWEPPNAPSEAVNRRGYVIADPSNRRTPHVKVL
jgi:hypothetical protein